MRTKFTILIADDDLDDQELMKRGLAECKVDVDIVTFYDGVQVMDYLLRKRNHKISTYQPDLILLDLNMPLMDGFQTLKEIKQQPDLKAIPVYVITTSRSIDHLNKALELGASGFYSKGAKTSEILEIMRQVCKDCFEDLPTDN
jgi:CheY-like chemotaxis protein